MKGLFPFLRRQTRGIPPPVEWMLEVTNRCNLACPMCLRHRVHFQLADMEIDFVTRLLEAPNGRPNAIWPYGYGEPLLYPQIFNVIRRAKEKNLVVSLSTNATLLDEAAANELLDSGLDYLIIAFDGATAQTYARYRKPATFDKVKANVERFLALKMARRTSLHVTVQMIHMQGTANEAASFRGQWTRDGVDCVRIREDLLKSRDASAVRTMRHRPCFFLWRGPLFVQAAGTVIPCPYYHGSEPFADLKTQDVQQAWNSPKMEEMRQAHVRGDLSKFPICAACPRYQPHALLASASFLIGTRSIRRYLPVIERMQQMAGKTFFE